MSKPSKREELAKYAHEAWSGWMRHVYGKCKAVEGGLLIPEEWADRWGRQMHTAYEDLSKEEQDSDRKEADRMLKIFGSIDTIPRRTPGKIYYQDREGKRTYYEDAAFTKKIDSERTPGGADIIE